MSTNDTHFTLNVVQSTKPKVCATNKPQLLISTSCYCSTPPLMCVCPKMATGADGGYGEGGCSVDDPRDRRGSRTPDRRASPPEPIMSVVQVVHICLDYA